MPAPARAFQREIPETIGLARLFAIGFGGGDYGAIIDALLERVEKNPGDAAAQFDLGTILLLNGHEEEGLAAQAEAIRLSPVFRQKASGGGEPLRLLMLAAPGGLMANTPAHFLLEGSGITLDVAFVGPNAELPRDLPEHDVLLVGVGESDATAPLIEALAPRLAHWPVPVLNRPEHLLSLAREQLWHTLRQARGTHVPMTVRLDRAELERLGSGETTPADLLGAGTRYPVIARPVGSHAGHGLEKLDDAAAVARYCAAHEGEIFNVSPFVDYRGSDGFFRKYRVAMVDGRPYACHVAIAKHWMLHYLNAGMVGDAEKRADEARLMEGFDTGFGARHATALADFARLAGLDYFVIDCAETPDGKLLVFEADTAMIVHDMDPPRLFPYKGPQMRKVFEAFRAMLRARAAGGRRDIHHAA